MKVEKRNGSLQDFDRSKLAASLVNAGATDADAQKVAVDVEAWAKAKAVNDVIKSQAMRDKVIAVLRTEYPQVAEGYEAFTKKPSA
ncbi:MAG: ATP cone domain-containing protein [bacterium]|nr:ATP cone domain-containing protein [bacterium]